MERILVTGALGQIGSELVSTLRERYGNENVIASDIKMPTADALAGTEPGFFEHVDCTSHDQIQQVVGRHNIDTIYHLAALLSAVAEERPQKAWEINMGGLYHVLEVARRNGCAVFTPSSIGAFGEGTPKDSTPQDTVQRPSTMYGVSKVAGELLCDYYYRRFGVDTRGVRYPGIISHVAPPGGGTTDYAVDIFYHAVRHGNFTSFLGPETRLDMMYMPDAIKAAVDVMEADPSRLEHRNAFNVTAMNFTPEELAEAIRKHLPEFEIDYDVDPIRQRIADSWPNSLDDSAARQEWDWQPAFDLDSMVEDMLENVSRKASREPVDRP